MPVPDEVKEQLVHDGEEHSPWEQPEFPDAPAPPSKSQSTIMDALRAKRDEQTGDLTCDITVPGFSNMVKARYGVLPTKEMNVLGKRISRQFKDEGERQLNAIVDVLIQACEGLYYVEPEDGSLTPIDPDESGVVVTYSDPRLPAFLDFEASTARETLFGVFRNVEPSIIAHGMKLSRWYEDTSKDVDEGFLGE